MLTLLMKKNQLTYRYTKGNRRTDAEIAKLTAEFEAMVAELVETGEE